LVSNYCTNCATPYSYEPGVHSAELCFACLSKLALDNDRLEQEIFDLETEIHDMRYTDCWGPIDSYEAMAIVLLFHSMARL